MSDHPTYWEQVRSYASEHTIEEMDAQEVDIYDMRSLSFLAHCKSERQRQDNPHKRGDVGRNLTE